MLDVELVFSLFLQWEDVNRMQREAPVRVYCKVGFFGEKAANKASLLLLVSPR